MNGTEIITFLTNNAGPIMSAVKPVVGAVFTAIFLRNKTVTKEFEKIKAGKMGEVAEDLLTSGKMTYTEFYKANNFLKVAQIADEYYNEMPHENNDNSYDFDWFIRFYEAVGNISDEKMQMIWAKILAGEINHPSTYSLRTIDILKNISKQEAVLFTHICEHLVISAERAFLPHYDHYMERCNISFDEVMYLDELGLISSDAMLVLKIPISNEPTIHWYNQSLVITLSTNDANPITIDVRQFPLTYVGKELASLQSTFTSNEDLIEFAKILAENRKVKVGVHKLINISGDNIFYARESILDI